MNFVFQSRVATGFYAGPLSTLDSELILHLALGERSLYHFGTAPSRRKG